MREWKSVLLAASVALSFVLLAAETGAQTGGDVLTGQAAFGDWRADKPGVRRHITASDLPAASLARSSSNSARIVARSDEQKPAVPAGFQVELFASGLDDPRRLRVAPNGDVFVAESQSGRIRVLRPADGGGRPARADVFVAGLHGPFGIAFYPSGDDPQWLYVANTDSVVRFPYRSGDLKASGPPETIVAKLPTGGHFTRDVAFSADGGRMFVSVGSLSNAAEGISKLEAAALARWQAEHPLGALWGFETNRADVLVFDPNGKNGGVFAAGIRNCVTMAIAPGTGDLWCATNERDGLGDNVPPDYVTRVREGAFYGWPWYYIGANEDPRHNGERPDLKDKVTVPDVLLQAHSAPLGMTFYDRGQFPAEYRGNIFVAAHGSWNRSKRTGYKVVRLIVKDGVPTGEYDDFATGFVIGDSAVWGRPVGVAVGKDGSLLISEDANGTIWRVTYTGQAAQR
ncbi:MAG: PQQ-dependent sugar dehydrogenase [Xanthobacteraceae bacterium]